MFQRVFPSHADLKKVNHACLHLDNCSSLGLWLNQKTVSCPLLVFFTTDIVTCRGGKSTGVGLYNETSDLQFQGQHQGNVVVFCREFGGYAA